MIIMFMHACQRKGERGGDRERPSCGEIVSLIIFVTILLAFPTLSRYSIYCHHSQVTMEAPTFDPLIIGKLLI